MADTIWLSAGGRSLKVKTWLDRGKIHFEFRRFAPLRSEIKLMRGSGCSGPPEWTWSAKDCPRNRLQLELLQGRVPPEIARYDSPLDLTRVAPRRSCLFERQKMMLAHFLQRKRCILAAEPGTCKTLAAIEGMEKVGGSWLYVAPSKVLAAISLEFEKWESQIKPRFVSYSSLPGLLNSWSGPAPLGVVFDESSRLKGAGPHMKAGQYLANAVRDEHDGFVWLLTGTPAPKAPTDWWSQAEIACPGFLVESSKAHLERRCAIIEPLDVGGRIVGNVVGWKEDQVKLLARRLSGLVLVIKSSDCQSLPEPVFKRVRLPPSNSALRDAKLVADAATTAVGAFNTLCQLSDGFVYTTDEDGVKSTVTVECPKDEALKEILNRYSDVGRLIVYARFRATVDKVVQICQGEGWEVLRCDGRGWKLHGPSYDTYRDALRELDLAQDSGRAKRLVFVAHPKSGGMGLTLTAAPAVVFYSSDDNHESRAQALKRAHREGMDLKRGLNVYDLCHLPTDELILRRHEGKAELQALTLDEIRACL